MQRGHSPRIIWGTRRGGLTAGSAPRKVHPTTGKVTGGRNAKNWFVLDNEIAGPKDWTLQVDVKDG